MTDLDNKLLHADVSNIREEIPAPEKRDFRIMVKSDHIRVEFTEGGDFLSGRVFGATERVPVLEALGDRGYRLTGGNFDTGLLVFEASGNRRIE